MVDTRDLKSLGPKRPCGFDSRPRHEKRPVNPVFFHAHLFENHSILNRAIISSSIRKSSGKVSVVTLSHKTALPTVLGTQESFF